ILSAVFWREGSCVLLFGRRCEKAKANLTLLRRNRRLALRRFVFQNLFQLSWHLWQRILPQTHGLALTLDDVVLPAPFGVEAGEVNAAVRPPALFACNGAAGDRF